VHEEVAIKYKATVKNTMAVILFYRTGSASGLTAWQARAV